MDLQNMEKQRLKAYNQYLKDEMEKQSKVRKQKESYEKKKQLVDTNEIVQRLNEDDVRRLNMRKNNALLLQQHNSDYTTFLKTKSRMEDEPQLRNSSFTDDISSHDFHRLSKQRQELKDQHNKNYIQQNEKRKVSNQQRMEQKNYELKHMDRMREIDDERKRNYNENIRKHEQNMNLYQRHSQLMNMNDEYRKNLQKFTDTDKDILHNVWRNEEIQRKRVNIENQELLKRQMDEFNQKKNQQKSHILLGDDLDKSIFRSVMRNDERNKRLYGQDLKSQMKEHQQKKMQQRQMMKEKYYVSGIFGGQQGRDRAHQIQYVDRKMGLSPKMNYSMEVQKKPYESEKPERKTPTPIIQREEVRREPSENGEKMKEMMMNREQEKKQDKNKYFKRYDLVGGKIRYFIG